VTWNECRWAELEPSAKYSSWLTVGAYALVSVVLLAVAVVAATLRVEFGDTGTSVVNGLHRYLTAPGATSLREACVATVLFLLASATFAVLAVAVASHRDARTVRFTVGSAAAVVVALLVGLWVLAPPAFNPRGPRAGATATAP
jgi:hypothetical protein